MRFCKRQGQRQAQGRKRQGNAECGARNNDVGLVPRKKDANRLTGARRKGAEIVLQKQTKGTKEDEGRGTSTRTDPGQTPFRKIRHNGTIGFSLRNSQKKPAHFESSMIAEFANEKTNGANGDNDPNSEQTRMGKLACPQVIR